MRNAKKTLSLVMVAIFTTFIVLSGIPAGAVTTAQAKAQVSKATAAVVKVEKYVKVASFNPTTATTLNTAATKEVAKVRSLGKTYTKTYISLVARYQVVNKKIAARKAAIARAAAALKKLYTDAEKAVAEAEKLTDADNGIDLVGDEEALASAQGAVTAALEYIVKLDKNSSNYKGLMARIDAANNVIVKAMDDKAAADAAAAEAKAAEEAAAKAAEEAKAAAATAETAVAAVEKAPLTTADEVKAIEALQTAATTAIAAVKDTEAAAAFTARMKVVAEKVTAANEKLAADAKAAEEAKKPATIAAVTAVDKTITVNFSKKPLTTPAAADFVVTKAIGTAAATTVTAVTVTVVNDTQVTLAVPEVAATDADQSVVYSVAYNAGTAVAAVAYVVPKTPVLAVDSVSALNYGEVLVAFNKAVDAALLGDVANYTVNGNAPAAVTAAADNKSVTLLLAYANKITTGGTAEVVIKKAIMGDADVTKTSAAIADGTMPSIVSATADGNSAVKVTFTEPINTVGTPADYKLDGLYFDQKALPSVNGRILTLTPSTRLAAGEHTLTVSSAVTDFAGYGMITSRDVKFTVGSDTVAPTVAFVSATQTKVVIKFSEKVASIASGITFNNGVAVTSITAEDDGMTYTIATSAIPASGTTTMTIAKANVADLFNNSPSADLTLTFTATPDLTRPSITSAAFATDAQNILYVTFDKAIALDGAYTLTETKSDGTTANVVVTAAYYVDTTVTPNVTVKTKIVLTQAGNANFNSTSSYKLQVTGVTDSPNPLANKIVDYVVSGLKVADLTAPAYVGTSVNGQSMYITFDDALDAAAVLASNFVYVRGEDNKVVSGMPTGATATLINSGKTVKLTWKTVVDDATNGLNPALITQIQWTGLKGADKNTVTSSVLTKATQAGAAWAAAAAAPAMGAVEITGAHTMTLAVTNDTYFMFDAAKALSDFRLKKTVAGTLMNLTNASYDATKKLITFTVYETLGTDAKYGGETVTLYTVAQPTMVDLFGQAFTPNAVGTVAVDKYAPTATMGTANATTENVTVTLSEPLSINGSAVNDTYVFSATELAQFIVLVNGTAQAFTLTASADGMTLTFNVTGGIVPTDVVNIKYFASPTATVKLVDANTNALGNLDLSVTVQ